MAFVRVSGYGQEEIDKARREGMAQFVEQAMCTVGDTGIPLLGTWVAKNATAAILTNKAIPYDSILIFSYTSSKPSNQSDYTYISLNLTVHSGQCQQIWSNGYGDGVDSYETHVAMYKVKKNSVISANVQALQTKIRASAGYWIIHAPAEE